MDIYDYIIIGSGISGMYLGLKLLENNINNFIILEKNSYVGGRLKTYNFEKTTIPTGAGVGRFNKDILLKNLILKLGLKIESFNSKIEYNDNIKKLNLLDLIEILKTNYNDQYDLIYNINEILGECGNILLTLEDFSNMNFNEFIDKLINLDLNNEIINKLIKCKIIMMIEYLNKLYDNLDISNKRISFKDFAIKTYGSKRYNLLKKTLGYTDYEKADCGDVLKYYELDDNYEQYPHLILRINNIINTMYDKLYNKICLDTEMKSFKVINNLFEINCSELLMTDNKLINNINYCCKKIIFANNLNIINKYDNIYSEIKSQKFIKIYAKINIEKSNLFYEKVKKDSILIVDNELQKIIPINYDKGIFMIAYGDNENAKFLNDVYKNDPKNYKFFENLIEKSINIPYNSVFIDLLKVFYWNVGTHYYIPMDYEFYNDRKEFIKKLQVSDIKNIFTIGECVSLNQGWCNSALESVENIFDNIIS